LTDTVCLSVIEANEIDIALTDYEYQLKTVELLRNQIQNYERLVKTDLEIESRYRSEIKTQKRKRWGFGLLGFALGLLIGII